MSPIFLWGLPDAPPKLDLFVPRGEAWWQQFSANCGLPPTARDALVRSSREIVALLPDPKDWGNRPKPFRGLVVGDVQSGKTASMLAVSATAIDQGYRIVVVLTGSNDDLRRQTARRFNTQLMLKGDEIPGSGGARTLPRDVESRRIGGFCLPYHLDAHQFSQLHLRLQDTYRAAEPAVLVIKKNNASLAEVRSKLDRLIGRFGREATPVLVIDDECDDASVDDSESAVIPAAIAQLWSRDPGKRLFAYLGYTATSAANLLQNQSNELFPSEFVYLLRSPGDGASVLTYKVPNADGWYSGGNAFYSDFGDAAGEQDNFVICDGVSDKDLDGPVESNSSLRDAIRAYLVAGAYRLALNPGYSFTDPTKSPKPHTMLVQTSVSVGDHRRWLEGIRSMFDGEYVGNGKKCVRFNVGNVLAQLESEEAKWRVWYERFTASRERLEDERPRKAPPAFATWQQVRTCIPVAADVVRIKAINSEFGEESDLDFAARLDATGARLPPQDIFTIAIGGSKLSRGLTMEGLAVTYFTRWTSGPTEDTVLQLSRWFGYRGPHLEFCRLFTTNTIFEELRRIHLNDVDLKLQLGRLMLDRMKPCDAALVLCSNPNALPTGKLGEGQVRDLSYSPWASVLRHVEVADQALCKANETLALRVVAEIAKRGQEAVYSASGTLRGMLSRGWTAPEIACILDSICFSDHNPSATSNPARTYYRKPDTSRAICCGRGIDSDPYQIAAYLKQWNDEGGAPRFNVGVAYGELGEDNNPFDFRLTNREVTPKGVVHGGWVGRRSGWRGDAFFDDPDLNWIIDGTAKRKAGADGLLLLYVVHKDAQGRWGLGSKRSAHTPMFGIVVPEGGKRWRRVTVDRRKVVLE